MEAARLLYVSITRGRGTCIVSYADRRLVYGKWRGLALSRFIPQLGGAFANRGGGLTPDEVQQITEVSAQL
jgi:superfamily I DNA/RNA helicase